MKPRSSRWDRDGILPSKCLEAPDATCSWRKCLWRCWAVRYIDIACRWIQWFNSSLTNRLQQSWYKNHSVHFYTLVNKDFVTDHVFCYWPRGIIPALDEVTSGPIISNQDKKMNSIQNPGLLLQNKFVIKAGIFCVLCSLRWTYCIC